MGAIAAVERFLERLFERQTARLFRTNLRPIQVQRRIERAIEANRSRGGARTIVPHRFVVRCSSDDLAALRAAAPRLAEQLADAALAFARAHGYTLLDRPIVTLRADLRVEPGDIAVDAVIAAAGAAARDEDDKPFAPDDPAPLDPTDDLVSSAPRPAASAEGTAVFVVPKVSGPRASLREIRPDRSSRLIEFAGRPLRIGRASDNEVVLRDGRASRQHARIDARRGMLVLTDLGSTNGSWVNDRRVESIALGEGDRIRLGTTTLIVEALEAVDSHSVDAHRVPTGEDSAAG
jgi:hypothetical protein